MRGGLFCCLLFFGFLFCLLFLELLSLVLLAGGNTLSLLCFFLGGEPIAERGVGFTVNVLKNVLSRKREVIFQLSLNLGVNLDVFLVSLKGEEVADVVVVVDVRPHRLLNVLHPLVLKLNVILSGEELANADVARLEGVRDKIEPRMVEDIRDFLENPSMDNQVALFSWFMAQEPQEMSEVDMAIYMPIIAYGAAERSRFLKEKGKPQTLEQVKEWMESPEAAEDSVYFVMDMVDRYNKEGKELPQDLRVVARLLEAEG